MMENLRSFIDGGLLELYVAGITTGAENLLVEEMAASYREVREELAAISTAVEMTAVANGIIPDPTIRPFVLASVDYTERLKQGEVPAFPPILSSGASVKDYAPWLERSDITLPADFTDFHAKIIGYTPTMVTAIVWIRNESPYEIHDREYEKFLIVEGTCDITIGEHVHQLRAGDYLSIPLYIPHQVKVTSTIPCKVILQRMAA